MTEALTSILCQNGGEWCFDPEGRTIKFNEDGTGELLCRCNFNYWIAAEFEWKATNSSSSSSSSPQDEKMAQTIGQLDISTTLTKRLSHWATSNPQYSSLLSKCTTLNERILSENAFLPKTNTVKIESGNFIAPCYVGSDASWEDLGRYANRIVFDKSPYPPQDEWKSTENGPEDGQFWEHREFVSGLLSPDEVAKRGGGGQPAMNDPFAKGGQSSCVVS